MITDNGVFCLRCGLPMVSKGDGNFVCYDKNCDYTFQWKSDNDGENIIVSMSSSFGIYLPYPDEGENPTGILRKL